MVITFSLASDDDGMLLFSCLATRDNNRPVFSTLMYVVFLLEIYLVHEIWKGTVVLSALLFEVAD
ncbi:MAG: hypothetical protein WCK53_11860 [Methanomicrobiales archaeon]